MQLSISDLLTAYLAPFSRDSLRYVQNRYIWLPLLRLTPFAPDGEVALGRSR